MADIVKYVATVNIMIQLCSYGKHYDTTIPHVIRGGPFDIQGGGGGVFVNFVMKHVCRLSKRAHHSDILKVLDIDNASVLINNSMKCLFKRLCSTDSPTRNICVTNPGDKEG